MWGLCVCGNFAYCFSYLSSSHLMHCLRPVPLAAALYANAAPVQCDERALFFLNDSDTMCQFVGVVYGSWWDRFIFLSMGLSIFIRVHCISNISSHFIINEVLFRLYELLHVKLQTHITTKLFWFGKSTYSDISIRLISKIKIYRMSD